MNVVSNLSLCLNRISKTLPRNVSCSVIQWLLVFERDMPLFWACSVTVFYMLWDGQLWKTVTILLSMTNRTYDSHVKVVNGATNRSCHSEVLKTWSQYIMCLFCMKMTLLIFLNSRVSHYVVSCHNNQPLTAELPIWQSELFFVAIYGANIVNSVYLQIFFRMCVQYSKQRADCIGDWLKCTFAR